MEPIPSPTNHDGLECWVCYHSNDHHKDTPTLLRQLDNQINQCKGGPDSNVPTKHPILQTLHHEQYAQRSTPGTGEAKISVCSFWKGWQFTAAPAEMQHIFKSWWNGKKNNQKKNVFDSPLMVSYIYDDIKYNVWVPYIFHDSSLIYHSSSSTHSSMIPWSNCPARKMVRWFVEYIARCYLYLTSHDSSQMMLTSLPKSMAKAPWCLWLSWLPSGKRLHNYGKWPLLMGKSTN